MKHLLLVAVVLSVMAAMYSISRVGKTKHLSISRHVAEERHTQLVFGGILIAATVLAALALFGYVLPAYDVDTLSHAIFGLIIILLAIISCVPHVVGTWREPIHVIAAYGFAWIALLAMFLMLTWPLSSIAWWIGLCLAVISATLVTLQMTSKRLRQLFLYFQSAFLCMFLGFLLVVAYL